MELDDVAAADAGEELFDVLIAQADAAVRFGKADGRGCVGAVDAVALRAEPNPAGADRIRAARADDLSRLVVRSDSRRG